MEKIKLTRQEIEELRDQVTPLIKSGAYEKAVNNLRKILENKIAFSQLDKIGVSIGESLKEYPDSLFKFLDHLTAANAMGSYVMAASTLVPLMDNNLDKVIDKAREMIIQGNVWHVCDNIAERVFGFATVKYFNQTLPYLRELLKEENIWLKRSAGVAIHYFNKRVRDREDLSAVLLGIMEPYVGIKERDVLKGIGWGLKTTGKYHPELVTEFIIRQLKVEKKLSRLLLKKAVTYLPEMGKEEIERHVQGI